MRYFGVFFMVTVMFLSPRVHAQDYRKDMRDFVIKISQQAKKSNKNFAIIPQNGNELITLDGKATGAVAKSYAAAIDGVGREDMFFGYGGDNKPTPKKDFNYLLGYLNIIKDLGKTVLSTDYINTEKGMKISYQENAKLGYLPFAAPKRDLSIIPSYPSNPFNENSQNILKLSDAKNFLYILNPNPYKTKKNFLKAVENTNYDIILIDHFFHGAPYSKDEITRLKKKHNGGERLVICYMSIGEAEDYRHYWKIEWKATPPSWLHEENPYWKGNYKVKYWDAGWQKIILTYLDTIVAANYDGVYLDIIDAFWHFENIKNDKSK